MTVSTFPGWGDVGQETPGTFLWQLEGWSGGKPPACERGGRMPTIYLYTPEDERPATWGNGTHIAFLADTREQVHAFHERALALGGTCEGPPGPRPHYGTAYYAAYVRDPDGNKLQAVCYAAG